MKVNIVMPKMGESIIEGTIIKWHKQVGDKVKKDDIIYEITTDKVDTEIPSPVDGILLEIKANENDVVPINEVVAVIQTEGNSVERQKESEVIEESGSLVEIPMPKMGESIVEGTIIKWHKKIGDQVKADDIIYEISTDKVDTEVPSPVDGILKEILFHENDVVAVGEIVAKIETKTGKVKSETKEISQPQEKTEYLKIAKEQIDKPSVDKSNRFYSPLVMNIANKERVSPKELDSIVGSGVGGRVTKKDIFDYINSGRRTQKIASSVLPSVEYIKGEIKTIPMDNIRKKIMEHMTKSRDTSVHVSEVMEVDMTKIHNFIEKNKEKILQEENVKLTYMAFISFAAIKALQEYPLVNSAIDGENIIQKSDINLGIAVAVEPNGLIVPNIKNSDQKSVKELANSIRELGNKARTKKLIPEDVAEGTFSITNYGVFGALFGTPIINQPEMAILGVGTVVKKPVIIDVDGSDTIAIKPMMYLTLTHDHRLVDGMLGGKFLKFIKDFLENFDLRNI
jgi:pyruvate dehydrogenase E2 component (dihydrolipoamide acetyltransferase)